MPHKPEYCRTYRQRLRQRALDVKGRCCAACGLLYDLEFAHVVETDMRGMGRGMDRRHRDVLKVPQCYILLCHDCHAKMDDAPW